MTLEEARQNLYQRVVYSSKNDKHRSEIGQIKNVSEWYVFVSFLPDFRGRGISCLAEKLELFIEENENKRWLDIANEL